MRKLTRMAAPDCWQKKSAQWNADYVRKVQENPLYKFVWRDTKKCFEPAKSILFSMTQKRCAFCDSKIRISSPETVEHFKPKSQYPELAYTWENLFPCCALCNTNKGEKFPTSIELLKIDEAYYDFSRYFLANFRTGEIEPNPHNSQENQQRALATIDVYDLNNEERCLERKREYDRWSKDNYDIEDCNYRFFLEAAL